MIVLFSLIIAFVFIKLYKRAVHQDFIAERKNYLIKTIKLPIVLGILLLVIRGGWGDVPLNTSDAYFSKHIILNDVTVNPNWNVIQSAVKSKSSFKGNPYKKYSDNESEAYANELLQSKNDSTTSV